MPIIPGTRPATSSPPHWWPSPARATRSGGRGDDADHPGPPPRHFLATPLVAEPGSAYHYSGGNTYVLSRVVHSVTGADLRDFLVPRLFAPLGIRNPQWLRCPLGFPLGAIGLQLRTSEIIRIAQLLLHEGTYG